MVRVIRVYKNNTELKNEAETRLRDRKWSGNVLDK